MQELLKAIPISSRGINKKDHPSMLPDGYCIDCFNMFVSNSKVIKRFGSQKIGNTLYGTGLEAIRFIDGGGDSFHLAFTDYFCYKYDSANNFWNNISEQVLLDDCEDTTNWTAGSNVAVAQEDTTVRIGSYSNKITTSADITAAKLFDIDLSGDSYDLTAARGTYNNTDLNGIGFWIRSSVDIDASVIKITLTNDAGGSPATSDLLIDIALVADTWTFVFLYDDFSSFDDLDTIWFGTDTGKTIVDGTVLYIDDIKAYRAFGSSSVRPTRISWSSAMDNGTPPSWDSATGIVVSDQITNPTCWDGSGNFEEFYITDFSGFVSVDEIDFHGDHLIFYAFNDGTARKKQMKWTDQLNIFGSGAWDSGTYGEKFLALLRGSILRSIPLGNLRVLYASDSVAFQTYLGGVLIYGHDSALNEIGLISAKAVDSMIGRHLFMGSDAKIYSFNGSDFPEYLNDVIDSFLRSSIAFSQKDNIVFGFDKLNKRLYCFYPAVAGGDTYAQSYFSLNLSQNPPAWERGRFGYPVTDLSEFKNEIEYACNSEWVGDAACDDDPYAELACNAVGYDGSYPFPCVISSDGNVYMLDENTGMDDTTEIECFLETGDFVVSKGSDLQQFRCNSLSFNAANVRKPTTTVEVTVEFSVDRGVTWTAVDDSPVTISFDWTEYTVEVDDENLYRNIRFRFSNTSDGDLQISDIAVHYVPGTVRD
jgi:hypothetical protein